MHQQVTARLSRLLPAKWGKRPVAIYLWERAMPAKNHGHGPGVPARFHNQSPDLRGRLVAVASQGLLKTVSA